MILIISKLKLLLATGAIISLWGLVVAPNIASAVDVLNPICNSQEVQSKPVSERPVVCRDDKNTAVTEDALTGPEGIITKGVNIFGIVIGVTAIIVLFLAGIKLITSSGDANKVSQARQAIIFAAVGLLVAGSARLIVEVILKKIG